MKKCVVVYNPVSGKEKNKECIEDFYTALKKYNYDLELIYTKKKGDAIDIVKNLNNPDLVISAGGDGTLNEVIKGNLSREERLLVGILPLGTTNDVGRMLGYTKDYVKNLDLLLSGSRRQYDIGLIDNNPFIYIATLGKLTRVSFTTPSIKKRKYGHLAYLVQGLKEIFKKVELYDIKYKINNKSYQGIYSYAFITNTNTVGGKKNIYKDVKLNDKLLEVIFVKAKTKLQLLKVFYYIFRSKIADCPYVEFYKTSHIDINVQDNKSVSWCIDGEELNIDSSKIKININSNSSMLIPNKNIDKLFK